jgi:hypothetical protein
MEQLAQLKELDLLVNRAKRAGLKVHHYPENNLAVIRFVPPPVVATDTPPAGAPPLTPTPVATVS